jgi:phenylalanyl-tRNA synthetase beta chain
MRAIPPQPRHVAAVLTGEVERSGWWGPGRRASWEDAVESVQVVARALAIEVVVVADRDRPPWHPGRCARIELPDGTPVGHAGELHPKVLVTLGLPARTCALELDVEVLTAASAPTTRYREISTYPAALSDIALVVPDSVTAAEVARAVRAGAGEALEELRLFDVYTGEQVGEGKRSLAYTLRFRAPDRTLTSEEANTARDAAVAVAAERHAAVLR